MALKYRAAVLHAVQTPMAIETITAAALKPADVLVRIRAAGLCHTDLEVIEGSLRYPMPIVLGHEAAGTVEQVGSAARGVKVGDHVVLSWNPHCGHCFYCDRDTPILCEEYLGQGPKGVASIRAMGKGVLIAESNVHHIPDYVDRIYVLERGEVMFSGTLAQAYQDRDVMRVIAGQIEVAS